MNKTGKPSLPSVGRDRKKETIYPHIQKAQIGGKNKVGKEARRVEKGEGPTILNCGHGRCPRGADPEVTALTTVGPFECRKRREAKLLTVW